MKKFLLLALAAFALAACNDDDTPDEFVQGDNTIAVFENDRLVFYDYDVFWEYSEPYTDPYGVTCIDLYMNKTRFVQNMPALDMEVPGIPIHPTPAGFEFDLRQAVPYYRGEPMPRYIWDGSERTPHAAKERRDTPGRKGKSERGAFFCPVPDETPPHEPFR
ncbi:MAG: lipoprotein [Alistipes sp.]|uniref:lipoprotein n=1 Tax=Alistipes sp. TaxID=1872444 RepID=UPI0023F15101|nr:lipoprotein [Alistipes sp.]MBS5556381.1 lipoprotein [Alistipes sp.]